MEKIVFARRDVLKGIASTPLAGIPLAAILADAKLAWQRTLDFFGQHL